MNDLIDREYLFKTVEQMEKIGTTDNENDSVVSTNVVLDIIDNAPSTNRCISVKDALPDTDGEYLVYTNRYEVVEYDAKLRQFGYTDKYIDEQGYNAVEWYEVNNVTHWMPLPKLPESEVQNG